MNQTKTWTGIIVGVFFVSILSGCQNDDRLKEVTSVQTAAELKQQKEFQESRAQILETDLAERQKFFQGAAGTYEGTVQTPDGDYSIRIRLVPTVPPYKPDGRIRYEEEVINDINALHFSAQIMQWKPGSAIGVMGCRVDDIRPDLNEGVIQIADPECPSFYEIHISDGQPSAGRTTATQQRAMRAQGARNLSARLMAGERDEVPALTGEVYPTSASVAYPFTAKRRIEQ